MGAALESGSLPRVAGAAPGLNSAASRADSELPPACADHGPAYQIAMHYWTVGASHAKDGNLTGTSSRIASGARELTRTPRSNSCRPARSRACPAGGDPAESRRPRRLTTAAPSTAPSVARRCPSTAPAAAPTQAATTPAGCHPLSNEGTCYEPGEYCRDDDHGTSGVAGDGEAITCEDNDGWRWEPA